ncbi:MAG: hypothetical protein LBV76_02160 [Deltaproteobacteria bacterium]|nr:hypothetical protein [Deltaproteobacteria bacterium]
MFADPFSNLMLVLLLFFGGLLIMFVFMMRSLDHNWRNQDETRRQLALSLSDLERKVDELLSAVSKEKQSVVPPKVPVGDFPPEDRLASKEPVAYLETSGFAETGEIRGHKKQVGGLKLNQSLPDLLSGLPDDQNLNDQSLKSDKA